MAKKCSSSLLAGWLVATADLAQGSTAQQDLLLTLSSPISGLARISADFDEDRDIGENEQGTFRAFRLHPVLPINLGSRFRLVSDTVLSASAERLVQTADPHWNRDTVLQETLSLSPARVQASGFQWAAGATVRHESDGEWGVGPSLTLVQEDATEVSGLTLAHMWSVSEDHGDLSTLDAFTTWTRNGTGLTLRLEATYDERTRQMLVPVGIALRRVFNTASVGVAVDLRARYYVDVPDNDGRWGAGVGLTFTRRFAE
ncbi:MAG TPA: hypothetical protein VMS40_15030 [Vicinamibacterales bacterium]|nr:hypothetical protein [Vicinamibacterales bacterium]